MDSTELYLPGEEVRNWVRLFKTNNVVNQCFVKISNVSIGNIPIFFVEEMSEAFGLQKLLACFSTKISVYLVVKS